MVKVKHLLIAETIIILVLLGIIANFYLKTPQQASLKSDVANADLLSKKIIQGAMEEKSYAIVNFDPLKKYLEEYRSKNNLNVSIYVENFRNGAYFGIQERTGFVPASLNKLPLAILIMKKVEEGKLSLDTKLKITDADRVATFGSLYQTKEDTIPLRLALEKLLKESDNTAFNLLLRYVTPEDVEFIIDYYNLDISLDFPEQAVKNHSNLISPKLMSNLFSSLYFSTVLEAENSAYLLSLMEDTIFDIETIAGLPKDVKIVHKFGEYGLNGTISFHDCGIIYMGESRIFYCIMSKGLEGEDAIKNNALIVRAIHEYVSETKNKYEGTY